MNIWISVPAPEGGVQQFLAIRDQSAKLPQVSYERTVANLRLHAGEIEGVFIPRIVSGVDYDFRYLIEHIRIDSDESIARVPIVVSVDLEDEFLSYQAPVTGFREELYRNIGVVLAPDPKESDFRTNIDHDAWADFQRAAGTEPHYGKGRHDQANIWGAYVVLAALQHVGPIKGGAFPEQVEQMRAIESRLLEDTYYKRRIHSLRENPIKEKLIVDIKRERSKFLANALLGQRILIVEDQLEDGWESAYSAIFCPEQSGLELVFANDVDVAKRHFNGLLSLILLDVRLAEDRASNCQNETDPDVSNLAGVKLAQWFQKQRNTAPMIAATASNKSWTLEALLGYGINNYWVKASPEFASNWDDVAHNLLDLYRKLNMTLDWSHRTRRWVDGIYQLSDIVSAHDNVNGRRLLRKANSLQALLFNAFSPFQKELSAGLQLNMAFILVYSCMNDLVSWILEKEEQDGGGKIIWYFEGNDGRCPVVTAESNGDRSRETSWNFLRHSANERSHDFPDKSAAIDVLNGFRLTRSAKRFRALATKRNGLPLIHGRADQAATTAKNLHSVGEGEIVGLVEVLLELAGEKSQRLAARAQKLQ